MGLKEPTRDGEAPRANISSLCLILQGKGKQCYYYSPVGAGAVPEQLHDRPYMATEEHSHH